MRVNSVDNTSFQAKINLPVGKMRNLNVESIEKSFAEYTKKFPDGVVDVSISDYSARFLGYSNQERRIQHFEAILSMPQWSKFLEKNEDTFANKIAKLFNMGNSLENEKREVDKFADKIIRKHTKGDEVVFFDKFYESFLDFAQEDIKNKIATDRTMKNWIVLI